MWDKIIEKTIDVEAKTSLQPLFGTRKINSKCPKRYKSLVKKDKDDTYWEQRDKASNRDKKKAKSHNPSFSANQFQTQAFNSKKYQRKGRGVPATRVNATKVVKKDKDKAKDLSHIKYYTCKQKGHYANKCLDKPKN